MWVVFRDFNVMRNPGERCNSQFFPSSAFAVNRFIQGADFKGFQHGWGKVYIYEPCGFQTKQA